MPINSAPIIDISLISLNISTMAWLSNPAVSRVLSIDLYMYDSMTNNPLPSTAKNGLNAALDVTFYIPNTVFQVANCPIGRVCSRRCAAYDTLSSTWIFPDASAVSQRAIDFSNQAITCRFYNRTSGIFAVSTAEAAAVAPAAPAASSSSDDSMYMMVAAGLAVILAVIAVVAVSVVIYRKCSCCRRGGPKAGAVPASLWQGEVAFHSPTVRSGSEAPRPASGYAANSSLATMDPNDGEWFDNSARHSQSAVEMYRRDTAARFDAQPDGASFFSSSPATSYENTYLAPPIPASTSRRSEPPPIPVAAASYSAEPVIAASAPAPPPLAPSPPEADVAEAPSGPKRLQRSRSRFKTLQEEIESLRAPQDDDDD